MTYKYYDQQNKIDFQINNIDNIFYEINKISYPYQVTKYDILQHY